MLDSHVHNFVMLHAPPVRRCSRSWRCGERTFDRADGAGIDMGQVTQPVDVRSRLREALELDLIGPGAAHPLADERLPGWVRPSNWYLAGFLIPRGAPAEQRADADADDDFDPEVAGEGGLGDDSTEDRRAAKKGFFPSSMGLSFLVAAEVDELEVTVSWGDYRFVKEGADAERSDGAAESGGARRDREHGRRGCRAG